MKRRNDNFFYQKMLNFFLIYIYIYILIDTLPLKSKMQTPNL